MNQTRMVTLLMVLAHGTINFAQTTAEAYFDKASREYVKEDKMKALRTLDQALEQHPGDARLLKLAEELIKEQQQQQQKQEQDQQQKQEKDQQQKQDDPSQGGQDKEQQQGRDDQQEQPNGKDPSAGKEQDRRSEPPAGGIAPQDAMRMLDALDRSEKDVQDKIRLKRRPATRRSIEKDW